LRPPVEDLAVARARDHLGVGEARLDLERARMAQDVLFHVDHRRWLLTGGSRRGRAASAASSPPSAARQRATVSILPRLPSISSSTATLDIRRERVASGLSEITL